jgi:hypothetical protein
MGVVVVLAGTIPRNIFFALNLRYLANVPWAVPLTGGYLWFFWKYLKGGDNRRKTSSRQLSAYSCLVMGAYRRLAWHSGSCSRAKHREPLRCSARAATSKSNRDPETYSVSLLLAAAPTPV